MQRSVEEYKQANEKTRGATGDSTRTPVEAWRAPPVGWCKVNCDAGFSKASGRMGMGIVVRDSEGNVLAARSLSRVGLLESIMGETVASYHAALLCKELALTHVILESDAKQVVNAIVSGEKNNSRFGHLVDDTKTILQAFSEWKCVHVNRTANAAAHNLAKTATCDIIDRTWNYCIPDCIRDVILMDNSIPSSD
jgi:ribonuclease HI